MGYSDLIDRLLDTRINEGMISSISKNKDRNADVGSLCSALLNGSLFRIPTKCIDIRDTHYYNKSPFDSGLLRYTISTESLNTQRGRDYRIYRMIKGNEISFTEVGFVVTLDFGVAKERNRIEMILNNRKGGHSLRFLKDGKSKIKLSGGFI